MDNCQTGIKHFDLAYVNALKKQSGASVKYHELFVFLAAWHFIVNVQYTKMHLSVIYCHTKKKSFIMRMTILTQQTVLLAIVTKL